MTGISVTTETVAAKALELTNQLSLSRDAFIRDADGTALGNLITPPVRARVTCACTIGFINLAMYDLKEGLSWEHNDTVNRAGYLLKARIENRLVAQGFHETDDKGPTPNWNDQPERTIEDVRALFEDFAK